MDGDVQEDRHHKKFEQCTECGQMTLEKVYTAHGVICCLGLWWLCCIGCCCCRLLRDDFCETCYSERFMEKAKEVRRTKLYMDDKSGFDQPVVDEGIKEEPPQVIEIMNKKKA